jgi:hypothetical protein
MKNILFALSLFALLLSTQAVQAQSQNIYRFNFAVDSVAVGTVAYVEVPSRLLSLWTLGGSFNVTNLGASAEDFTFTMTLYGTSDESITASTADILKWQSIKQVTVTSVAAGATSYQHFRAANEMFYLGHTRYMIQLSAEGDEPGAFAGTLVLKKR